MKALSLFLAAWIMFISASCQQSEVETDRLPLLATDRKRSAAITEGDMEHILSFWAEDAMVLFPGAPLAAGKESIRDLVVRNRQTPGFDLSTHPAYAVVAASGDLGYTFGMFDLSVQTPPGKTVSRKGHYVCIWKKKAEGVWKCVVDMANFRSAAILP